MPYQHILVAIDLTFISSNLLKIPQGAWMPLVFGALLVLIMWTWTRGSQILTEKSRRVLRELFEALLEDIDLLPAEHRCAAAEAEAADGRAARARVVADYVAGMTDRFAILEHRRLFDPDARS